MRSCRKQGPRPNLPRRPGGPRPRRRLADRVQRLGVRLLCLLMFVGGGWVGIQTYHIARHGFDELFTVREIQISGLAYLSRSEVLARLDVPVHETLFTVSPKTLRKELETHPWIKEARVSREPFHSLCVEIIERQPAAVLQTSTSNILLDREGVVLTSRATAHDLMLPVLVGLDPGRLQAGDTALSQSVQAGIKVAGLMAQSYGGTPQVDLGDPQNMVGYVQGLRFAFGATSLEEKWARYHQIEPTVRLRLVEAGTELRSEIDLRYPGKVIVRERG